jgi:hypothetical protein
MTARYRLSQLNWQPLAEAVPPGERDGSEAGLTTPGLALVSMRFGAAARHAHGHATLGLGRWRGRELRLHRFARSGLTAPTDTDNRSKVWRKVWRDQKNYQLSNGRSGRI